MAAIVKGLVRSPINTQIYRAFSVCSVNSQVAGKNIDTETHTGQQWAKDDYRRARFVNRDKQVNTEFAIDLIAKDPIVVCEKRTVWSSSGGALGHPKVFINLDKEEVAICGYSGRKFIQKKYYKDAEHGPSITYDEYLKQMQS